jgi:outer membrane protein TolC
MKRVLFALAVLSTGAVSARAQRTVTLEECLRLAQDHAPAMEQARRNYQIASANAEASSKELRSTVDLALSAPIYTDAAYPTYNPTTGTTQLLTQHQSQFGGGLIVSQPIYWTGGSIKFRGDLFRRAQQGLNGSAVNDYLGSGSVSIDQPIFVPNEYKLRQRESDMDLDLAYTGYAAQWATVNFKVRSLFFNLYQAEQELAIQRDEVTRSQANYDLASNKYKAGLIAEVDALQLEVDLASARTDLFDRERRLQAAQRDLLAALGLPLSGTLTPRMDSLQEVTITVDPARAVQEAFANRQDLMSVRYDIARHEIGRDRLSSNRTISASLTGTFGATQNAIELANLSDNPYVNRGVTLSVNVPVFDWGAHSTRMDAAESSIELSRVTLTVKEQQVEQEVRSVIEQLEASKKQGEVARKSVEVAQKAYDLSRSRFEAGKITSQDLTLAQQRLTRARLSSLNAQVAEHLALADLTQKTLFDFEANRRVEVKP